MIRQCGWCKKVMGEKEPLEDTSITTGICDPCRDAHFAKKMEAADVDLKIEMERIRYRGRNRGDDGSDEAVLGVIRRAYSLLACEYLVAGDAEKAHEYAALVIEADETLMQMMRADMEAANG